MNEILSVTQLNTYVKSLLDGDRVLNEVFVQGEISDFHRNRASGHLYFSIKDTRSVISAAMFAQNAMSLRFEPENGMKVIVRARVSLYVQGGRYQLIVSDVQPDGVGAMAIRLAQLMEKLEKEGLFDRRFKKPLPRFPQTVGVITAPTGAAIRDIVNVIRRRYPLADIVLSPVVVQGDAAAKSLENAVRQFSESNCADVLIIGRGGGSTEDLWAFNDEALARAIFDCRIPIISAVGHERDHTICDYVADVAAPTPSAAAELAVPNRADLEEHLSVLVDRARDLAGAALNTKERELNHQRAIMQHYSRDVWYQRNFERLSMLIEKARMIAGSRCESAEQKTKELLSKAEALSPLAVLARGYGYAVRDKEVIASVDQMEVGDDFDLHLKDGAVRARVLEKESLEEKKA